MNGHIRAVIEFARAAIDAEYLTPAGVINLIGLFILFIVIVVLGLADLWQALVRTWNKGYETGLPSPLSCGILFATVLLLCTLIVGLLYRRAERP